MSQRFEGLYTIRARVPCQTSDLSLIVFLLLSNKKHYGMLRYGQTIGSRKALFLRQHFLIYDARYIGQAEVPALEFEGEAFVIDAETVEDGSLNVVDRHGIGNGVVRKVVGFAYLAPRLIPPPANHMVKQPDGDRAHSCLWSGDPGSKRFDRILHPR